MNTTANVSTDLEVAEKRVLAAAVAFRKAVMYEARRLSMHDSPVADAANSCACRACVAADELNEASLAYGALFEAS